MSTPVVVFIVIAAVVVLVALAAWRGDARRNKHVAEDEDRLEQPREEQ
ncbi:hypothetical protein FB381_3025 [Nocardioides albertanoniae]|uniref:Uncharacterized protein n=1 Tax=Nocardioides albertanoniae TaxID=1175486 RepID=A0A543A942_9ACTN|nr:hypothetical protein [Nocardioides albertanoniae]TQL69123.1 hypothetical protein FB381_3025 [Nocardioides albertanoniae]